MKECVNCLDHFEPSHGKQKYCCVQCRNSYHYRNQTPEQRQKNRLAQKEYYVQHPEKIKQKRYTKRKNSYLSGKLPAFMYT